jgi:PAS domain S-box-containing protein
MLEQIQQRDANLERRVQERTEELARSLSLLNATLESTADGIIASDRQGNVISLNTKFMALFGFPPDMIERRVPAEMRNYAAGQMKDPDAFLQQYKNFLARAETSSREMEMKDGRVLERHAFPQYIGQNWVGMVVNWRDITISRNAEKALRESEALYSSLVEQLPIGVYRKDAENNYVFVNSRFCQLRGLSMDQIIGQSPNAMNPPEKAAQFKQEHELIMSSGKSIELEETYPVPGGETHYFHVVKLPVVAADGKIVGTQGVYFDITQRKRTEAELEKVHRELLDASRRAGMAEVATGVLHNVGNVLNSVNVSASVMAGQLKKSRVPYLALAANLLKEHAADLGNFVTNDPKGKQLPGYFISLSEKLADEQATMLLEANSLQKNIEHIKDIVATQQNYAKTAGMTERVKVVDLLEDALRMNEGSLLRHDVQVVKKYADELPEIIVDRHKAIQILVNLIRNAKFACEESTSEVRRIILNITLDTECIRFCVQDNGVGIPAENLTRIFNHGFTTRKNGHGFGLHSGALAAKEMRGALIAQSDGPGKGARFILELPLHPAKNGAVAK